MSSNSSDVVKISIQVKGQEPEILKKSTSKGTEIIEVGGAVFYRKRKSVPAPPPEADTLAQDVRAADVDQTVTQTDASLESLEKQLDECLPDSCPRAVAVQFALDQLLARGAATLDRTLTSEAIANDEVEGAGAGVYSQATKRIMHTLSSLIQKKVEEAGTLLLAAQSPAVPPSSDTTLPHGVRMGGAQAAEKYFSEIPPIIRELSRGSQMLPLLQHRLKSLEEEEASWLELRSKCQAPPSAPLTHIATMVGEEGSMDVDPPAHSSLLKETEEAVNSSLALQVESLSAFLAKVGALVAKGEAACAMLQADYHQDKFKTFPHMNSPAWLIRQIVNKGEKKTQLEI